MKETDEEISTLSIVDGSYERYTEGTVRTQRKTTDIYEESGDETLNKATIEEFSCEDILERS